MVKANKIARYTENTSDWMRNARSQHNVRNKLVEDIDIYLVAQQASVRVHQVCDLTINNANSRKLVKWNGGTSVPDHL